MSVDENDTIDVVQDRLGLDCEDGYLALGGKPLRYGRCVKDYMIHEGTTLDYTTRQRGGCFLISISLWFIILISAILSVCTCGLSCSVVFLLLPFACLLPFCCL